MTLHDPRFLLGSLKIGLRMVEMLDAAGWTAKAKAKAKGRPAQIRTATRSGHAGIVVKERLGSTVSGDVREASRDLGSKKRFEEEKALCIKVVSCELIAGKDGHGLSLTAHNAAISCLTVFS